MIHQVRASLPDVERLRQLVALQLSLLRLAANESTVTEDNIADHLQSHFGDSVRHVAQWVTNKPNLINRLNEFASHTSTDEKLAFVSELEIDVALLYDPQPRQLSISFSDVLPSWKKSAGHFCTWFYELFGQKYQSNPIRFGFPGFLFSTSVEAVESFSRWDFVDSFTRQNPTLYLCAICDATAYRATIDSKAYTSIEHFFPKSIYPHLIIHPYNLIPICTYCNSGAARSNDPLAYCSETLGVTELLLPYREQQPGLTEQAYIEVRPRTSVSSNDSHPLEIHIRSVRGRDAQALISSFERIYRIEERWNADMDQIDQHVFRRMTQFLSGDVQWGNHLADVDFVIDRLELLMALTSRESLGRDPFSFATIWILKHHIDSIRQEGENAAVYLALHVWARGQQQHWKDLRQHVEDLFGRVRVEGER